MPAPAGEDWVIIIFSTRIRIISKQGQPNKTLASKNDQDTDINQPWLQDNQAWWDWYVTLADNKDQDNVATLVEVAPSPDLEIPSDAVICDELTAPYELTEDHCLAFRRDGFIKLPNVLSPAAVVRLRRELLKLFSETFAVTLDSGKSDRFLSLEMMWLENNLIRG